MSINVLFKIIVEIACCLDFNLSSFQHNLIELLVYWISIKALLELIVKINFQLTVNGGNQFL